MASLFSSRVFGTFCDQKVHTQEREKGKPYSAQGTLKTKKDTLPYFHFAIDALIAFKFVRTSLRDIAATSSRL